MGPIASLGDLIAALRRRLFVMFMILAFGLPASVWYALQQPRIYEATGLIQIEASAVSETLAGQSGSSIAQAQLDLIQQKMFSRGNLAGLIERFDLFAEGLSMAERVGLLRGAIIVQKLIDPAQSWRPDVHPSGLSITVRMEDPVAAAEIANALLDSIMIEARARSEGRATQTLAFLMTEEERVAAEVTDVEDQIAQFRQDNVDSLPEGLSDQRSRVNALSDALITIDRDIIALQSGSERLRAEEAARQLELLGQQRDLIADSLAQTETALAAAPAVERELGAMTRTLQQLEAELTVLTTRRTEAAMNQLLEIQEQSQRFEILETALVPEYPVSTSRKKLAIAGGLFTSFVALGVALAIEILNPTMRTAAQMQKQLGILPVVVIPVLRRPGAFSRRIGIGIAVMLAIGAGLWAAISSGLQPLIERIGPYLPRAQGTGIPGE
jgi:tyrosine-protein kinase Etk/Wzc